MKCKKDLNKKEKKIINSFKKLTNKKGWKANRGEINAWQLTPDRRSFHTIVTLPNGKKGFFKHPILSTRKKFLREITFLKYLSKKVPRNVPVMYEFSTDPKFSWYLIEALDLKNGVICDGEKTKILKIGWIEWLLTGLSKIQSLPQKEKIPAKLYKQRYPRYSKNKFGFYKNWVTKRLKIIKENQKILPSKFPFEDIRKFLKTKRKKFLEEENGAPLLIHGDFVPHNIYLDIKRRRAVFLDWEFLSINKNAMIAKSFDFSNFYLRLWQNKTFQEKFVKLYLKRGMATLEQIQAGVIFQSLGYIDHLVLPSKTWERGSYLKKHLRNLIKSINDVLI